MTAPGSQMVTCGQTTGWALKQRGAIHAVSPPATPLQLGSPRLNTHLILGRALFSVWLLYGFPVAAVTNDHRLSGLKQQKFILSQFWRPEVQNQVQKSARHPPLKPLGETPSLPLPASGGSKRSSACDCIPPILTLVFTWPHDPVTSTSVSFKDTHLLI